MKRKRKRGPKPKHPLPLLAWNELKPGDYAKAVRLGFSEEEWENNRRETLRNLWIQEDQEISFNVKLPPRRVRLMTGDPARSRLMSSQSFCMSQRIMSNGS